MPVFTLSSQKNIALEVTVTNLHGDDAYEASVIANFPSLLTYSAYRISPRVSYMFHNTSRTNTRFTVSGTQCDLLSIAGAACHLHSESKWIYG